MHRAGVSGAQPQCGENARPDSSSYANTFGMQCHPAEQVVRHRMPPADTLAVRRRQDPGAGSVQVHGPPGTDVQGDQHRHSEPRSMPGATASQHQPQPSTPTLDLAGAKNLKRVSLADSSLTSLDLGGCTALEDLQCQRSLLLTRLCVSGCSSLHTMSLHSCCLQQIDLTGCAKLHTLDCNGSPLESLDLTGCASLRLLTCARTRLKMLDVSPVAATLESVMCDSCPL